MIWCGSVGVERTIGTTSVPTNCWKVIFVKKTGLEKWKVKKEEVEKLTGYTFQLN
jgi:hypothetical protein